MTYPQTSPPPPSPPYPATYPSKKSLHPDIQTIDYKDDGIAYVGNEKLWPKVVCGGNHDIEEEMYGPEKMWDDDVGKYPASTDKERRFSSTEELLAYLEDLAERQKLLTKGLFLLKNIGSDFVGRSGEL